jgi:hypothetical protein
MTGISNSESFWLQARSQRVCAVCGHGGHFQAHHVVPKQWLRVNGFPEEARCDTRNALRLCERCHMQYTWGGPGKVQIQARHLVTANFCYVWALMAEDRGGLFLQERYGGAGDRRWLAHHDGECPECQVI